MKKINCTVKVNPTQSRAIQEFLFIHGYKWYSGYKHVLNTDREYLCISTDMDITWKDSYSDDAITFEQFKNLYMKPAELKITPDKVLSAAKKCPQAKEVLKEMFPEVFEEDKYLKLDESPYYISRDIMCTRSIGNYKNKAYWLSGEYNWEIVKDNENKLCLIPTKKY